MTHLKKKDGQSLYGWNMAYKLNVKGTKQEIDVNNT